MNWKLAVLSVVVILSVSAVAQSNLTVQIPISTTIAGFSPWLDVKAYGAVGDGSHDDQPAIQAAITACPSNGCTIFFPAGGGYKIGAGLSIDHTHNGVKLLGECGAPGSQNPGSETCSHIVASTFVISAPLLTVGDGTTGFHSGFTIQDLGFQDISTGKNQVIGAIHLWAVQDFNLTNVHCQNIEAGYCFLFDGGGTGMNNFTQFGVVVNPSVVDVKFPVQVKPQASEINFFGGNLDCNSNNNPTPTTIGMDLGKTFFSSGNSTGGEFGIFGTHIMNCDTGISMYNMSNLNYYGIMEQTVHGQTGDGIVLDGDASGKGLKSIIAGSIDEFNRGLVLQGVTQDT